MERPPTLDARESARNGVPQLHPDQLLLLFNALAEGVALARIVYDDHEQAIDFEFLEANPAFENHSALPPEHVIGQLASRIYGSSPPPFLDLCGQTIQSAKSLTFEAFFPATQRQFRVTISPAGEHRFTLLFCDISHQSESDNQFRVLFESSRDAILILTETGILECNQACLEMFRCSSKEQIASKSLWLLSPTRQPDGSDSKTASLQRYQLALKEGVQFFEWDHRRLDGSEFPAEVLLTKFELRGRKLIQAVIRDITERKAAERELRNLSRAVSQSPVTIMITDLEGRIEYVNPKFTATTGYAPEEVIGQSTRIFKSGQTKPEVYADLWKTILSGKEWRGEFLNRKKNGDLFWESASISPITDSQGKIIKFLSVKEDITEKKQRAAAIEESENRFRQLTENLSGVFWMASLAERCLLYVSPSYERVWGRSRQSLFEKLESWMDAIHPEDRPRMENLFKAEATGNGYDETYRIIRPDGSIRWIHDQAFIICNADGAPYRAAGIAEDITESKQLHEQFLRIQRTESIGTLASGLAHDLNNVLSPIMMAVSMLREQLTDPLQVELLTTMHEAAEQGSEIVKEVMGFARGVDEGTQTNLSPDQLLVQLGRIIQKTFPKSIVYRSEIPPDIWSVHANSTQLHQVLLNLCVNARDAMPNGGALTIRAENCAIDEHLAAMMEGARPGQFVLFKVIDTGEGIPEEIIKKIFDPFFTTKAPGRGTGLGLSTVLGIVKHHHGFIKVDSKPREGSTIQVFLPATETHKGVPTKATTPSFPQGQGACVLLVDDEETILSVMGRVLLRNGYRVLTAHNGVEAVKVFSSNPEQIDIVITDVLMPQMDGTQLARTMLKIAPNLPIIASSGHSSEAARKELEELGVKIFLKKPYSAAHLLQTLDGIRTL